LRVETTEEPSGLRLVDRDGNTVDLREEYEWKPEGMPGLQVRVPVPGVPEGTIALYQFDRTGALYWEELPLADGGSREMGPGLRIRRQHQWHSVPGGMSTAIGMPRWAASGFGSYKILVMG
jgi:hypothetical protein